MAVPKPLVRAGRAMSNGLPGFKNLRRTDRAEIEVARRHLPVSVEVTEGAERKVLWQRLLVRAPFFADYQKRVERQIPMAVLTPMT
jgi:hypothetical protein